MAPGRRHRRAERARGHPARRDRARPDRTADQQRRILGPTGPMWEVDLRAWWRTVHINLFGALVYTRLAMARMVPRQRGRIVNITSQAGAFRWPTVSAYSVSKAAAIKLTENLAIEARRHGISIFSIHPGLLPIGLAETALSPDALPGTHDARVTRTRRRPPAHAQAPAKDRRQRRNTTATTDRAHRVANHAPATGIPPNRIVATGLHLRRTPPIAVHHQHRSPA